MPLPGRQANPGNYRYGFNGMEKDDELKGSGNSYDFGARIFDSRIARWSSLDPWAFKYPWQTTYAYHRNSPIAYTDWKGFGDPPEKGEYEIKDGDTYWDLENEWGLEHGTLQELNPDTDPTNLAIGQIIKRPYKEGNFMVYPNDANIKEANLGALDFGEFKTYNEDGELMLAWQEGIVEGVLEYADAYYKAQLVYIPFAAYRGVQYLGRSITQLKSLYNTSANVKGLLKMIESPPSNLVVAVGKVGDDIVRYLDAQGAEAAFMVNENGAGTIILREGASEAAIVEELIHFQQYQLHGEQYFLANRAALEVAAQDELLAIGKEAGWGAEELARIQRAKEAWIKMIKNSNQGN